MTEYVIVYITASGEEEAEKIARALLDAKLAACVNIVRNVRSIYRWQGKIEDESEVLMIVKSRRKLFGRLLDTVKKLHSYSVPEVVAMPVIEGSEEYLAWLGKETSQET
jgi:periplasmic divalent cation tolerance protein